MNRILIGNEYQTHKKPSADCGAAFHCSHGRLLSALVSSMARGLLATTSRIRNDKKKEQRKIARGIFRSLAPRAMAARIAASSFSSAPSSPRLERRGAPGSKREPTTEEVRPARTSSPRFLLVLKSRAAALFDRGCSKIGTSRSFAGRSHALFETCCGGGLWLLVRASAETR